MRVSSLFLFDPVVLMSFLDDCGKDLFTVPFQLCASFWNSSGEGVPPRFHTCFLLGRNLFRERKLFLPLRLFSKKLSKNGFFVSWRGQSCFWVSGFVLGTTFGTAKMIKNENSVLITIHIPASKFPDLATCINNQSQRVIMMLTVLHFSPITPSDN